MPRLSQVKLTKRAVDAAPVPSTGDRFVWDNEVRGFGLRVYASGRRLFVYQYQAPATALTRRLTLGEFGALTVDQARDAAKRAAAQLALGRDPQGDDRDALQRRTVHEVFAEYLTERRPKVAERTYDEWARIFLRDFLPLIGARAVGTVDAATLRRWHAQQSARPVAANRAIGALHTFFEWCERLGYRERHSNPCAELEHFPEEPQGRSLSADEYAQLGSALRAARLVGLPLPPALKGKTGGIAADRRARATGVKRGSYRAQAPHLLPAAASLEPANPVVVDALLFLTLSGWREQEALTLRRDAVNFDRGVAVLRDSKTGVSERPLGAAALDILRRQPALAGNPYFFPGTRTGAHLAEPKRLWQTVKHAAGLEATARLRLHDLRHSFTTVARDELGYGDHIIARLVGHRVGGTTSRYGTVRDATVRAAADAISAAIADHLKG